MTQNTRDYGDRETTDEALCSALNDDLRDTIAQLSEARGQTTAGVVKAGVKQIEDHDEGRIIEFPNVAEARSYYKYHKRQSLEFAGAHEELTPEGYYSNPAECVGNLLKQKEAVHKEKANAAARYLEANDSDTKVVVNEYGSPEGIPQLDDGLEVQHGVSETVRDSADNSTGGPRE